MGAMEDTLGWTNGESEEHLHGCGRHHEERRKGNGRLLNSQRSLSRLRVDAPLNISTHHDAP